MTIGEFITGRFISFGVRLSEADLLEMCISLDVSAAVDASNLRSVNIAICKFMPSLLARPSSMSEGGVSNSWDKNAMKEYYKTLCKELGLPNSLQPSVRFIQL